MFITTPFFYLFKYLNQLFKFLKKNRNRNKIWHVLFIKNFFAYLNFIYSNKFYLLNYEIFEI